MRRRPASSRSSFTLVELLVVVAVIAVMMGLLLPGLKRARDGALRTKCLGTLQNLGVAMRSYATDHDGRYPLSYTPYPAKNAWLTWDAVLLVENYASTNSFRSPADRILRKVNGAARSYALNGYFCDDPAQNPDTVAGNPLKITRPLSNIVLMATVAQPASVVGSASQPSVYGYSSCTNLYAGKGANFLYGDLHVAWSPTNNGDNGTTGPNASLHELVWHCSGH